MACCLSGSCPMHKPAVDDASVVVTQSEADRCCATSEQDDSAPSPAAFVPLVALGPAISPVPDFVPAAYGRFGAWRTAVPIPGTQVPKHLLFSVFLI
jgi:hypothetical protein